jgi:DegV family protein with EDD domain
MKIVTDSGADLILPPERRKEIDVEIVPLTVTLDGKSYREGIDIETKDFYDLLESTTSLPTTSQPSAGDFANTYRKLAESDPDILSIHISSGLSGTLNAARAGAEMVPEANVTHFDTKTLSAAAGWMVEAAYKAVKAGWTKEKIIGLLERIRDTSESVYSLRELQYLINGGRISHMRGLIASMLNIKPIIGVEKEGGTYAQWGQERTFNRALDGLVKVIQKHYKPGEGKLRIQVLHSLNPEGAEKLKEKIAKLYDAEWLPMGSMSLVLGAHTGPSMVGVAFGRQSVFDEIPA